MAEKKIYPKGIMAFSKSEKQPDFVKGAIIITPDELVKWLRGDGAAHLVDSKFGKQLKLQITEYEGKFSLSVDNWKPTGQSAPQPAKKQEPIQEAEIIGDDSDSLPF